MSPVAALYAHCVGAAAAAELQYSKREVCNEEEYFGSCHCKDGFRFRIKADIENGRNGICNCSRCEKLGFLHHHVQGADFEVVRGDETNLTVYTFNTGLAKHKFCPKCGVQSFYRSRSDNDMFDVNLRCIEDLDIYALKYWLIDGQNWEDSQNVRRAYEAKQRRPQLFTILGVHPDGRAFFESSHPISLPPGTTSEANRPPSNTVSKEATSSTKAKSDTITGSETKAQVGGKAKPKKQASREARRGIPSARSGRSANSPHEHCVRSLAGRE